MLQDAYQQRPRGDEVSVLEALPLSDLGPHLVLSPLALSPFL